MPAALHPHTLSEAEERIINIKDVNGVQALSTLYDMITTRFTYRLEVAGEVKELTRGRLTSYVYSPDPTPCAKPLIRSSTAVPEARGRAGEVYAARARGGTRGKRPPAAPSSPASVQLGNDIPDAVTDVLLRVIRQNAPLFQHFRFNRRPGPAAPATLRHLCAPERRRQVLPFDDAMRMVDEAYRAFSPTLADLALRVPAERHLDSEQRPRKLGRRLLLQHVARTSAVGAAGSYAGKINDVSTLAHELGHAVHALMAAEHSTFTFHSALPMAETASGFRRDAPHRQAAARRRPIPPCTARCSTISSRIPTPP